MNKVNTQPQTDVKRWRTESVLLGKRLLLVHVVAVLLLRVEVPAAQRTLLITLETDTHVNTPDQKHTETFLLYNPESLMPGPSCCSPPPHHCPRPDHPFYKTQANMSKLSLFSCRWQNKTRRRDSRGRVAFGVTVWHPKEIPKMLLLFTSASSAHG